MSTVKIGVDVGNYDTKTQKKSIPSGYKKYSTYPAIAKKVLSYNGAYYVPDIECRIPYVLDKTENNQCIILSLIGIAEEIICQMKERALYF